MPEAIQPMLAELTDRPSTGRAGCSNHGRLRAVAEVRLDVMRLTAAGRFLEAFPQWSSLKVSAEAAFDGEVVAVDSEGKSQIRLLRNYRTSGKGTLVYYIFDLLHLEGHDLTSLPLVRRRELLRQILPKLPHLRVSEAIPEQGEALYAQAVSAGLEGVIGKDGNSPYQSHAQAARR
jgi:bifunctional non-homologous end joining protein LigD